MNHQEDAVGHRSPNIINTNVFSCIIAHLWICFWVCLLCSEGNSFTAWLFVVFFFLSFLSYAPPQFLSSICCIYGFPSVRAISHLYTKFYLALFFFTFFHALLPPPIFSPPPLAVFTVSCFQLYIFLGYTSPFVPCFSILHLSLLSFSMYRLDFSFLSLSRLFLLLPSRHWPFPVISSQPFPAARLKKCLSQHVRPESP